jgi:NadR type nicotinamide-nucleotide adenylyltransferase
MTQVKKIAVIGGESTGKSTLCLQLAKHFHTSWVKEYAREYLEKLKRKYNYDDLLQIAKGQIVAEDKQINHAQKFLFCDTNLLVIQVWSAHKYKQVHEEILREIPNRKYDAYLITAPDFPWQQDPLREHPEMEMRLHFYELYKNMVKPLRVPFCNITGTENERLQLAISFLENL